MSRLEKVQKKRLLQSTIFLLLILIGLLIIFFTFGLNLILTASSFISQNFSQKNEPTITSTAENFATIDITSIPTATNSAKFLIIGNALNVELLDVYLNDKKIKEIPLSADSFDEKLGELSIGENKLYLVGRDKNKKILKKTPVYTILYKPEKPKLEIKSPEEGQKVETEEVKVIGSTDKETFIKINDMPVVVDALGNFQSSVKLQVGENKIKITAEDQAGNIEEQILTIIYQKED